MDRPESLAARMAGMAVHVFTAAGAFCAFMALTAVIDGFLASSFGWLGLALIIDGVDGLLARRLDVQRTAPHWDGAVLDLVVDYLTYVLVPLVAIWRAGLLPEAIATPLCGLVASAAALYFSDVRMKTRDHFFSGFPALWNVVAFYLFSFPLPPYLNAIVMAFFAVVMFAPVVFVHPVRVERWRGATLVVTVIWLIAACWILASGFGPGFWARSTLILAGLYFLILSGRRSLARPPD